MLNGTQLREVFDHIVRERTIPLKFAYLGSGAQHWNDMIASYANIPVGAKNLEKKPLEKAAAAVVNSLDTGNGISVFDLGCGNGEPVIPLLEIIKRNPIQIFYSAFDLSDKLGRIAEVTVKGIGVEKTEHVVCDFEGNFDTLFKNQKNLKTSRLYLMLGNTLANMSNPKHFLEKIASVLREEDALLVGLELQDTRHVEHLMEYYGNAKARTFVYYVPSMFGITAKNTALRVFWDEKNSQVCLTLEALETILIKCGGESHAIHKGELLSIAHSKKYTPEALRKLFSFSTLTADIYQEDNYSVTILKKAYE